MNVFHTKICGGVLLLIFVCGTLLFPISISSELQCQMDSCDIPTWSIGDHWIYTADPVFFSADNISFSGVIENFKREILGLTEITHGNQTYLVYEVSLTGSISGVLTFESLSGDLQGTISGMSYIRVSDLAEVTTELISTGSIQILFISRDYTITNINSLFPPLELHDFPLHVYEAWNVSTTAYTSGSFEIEDIIQQDYETSSPLTVMVSSLATELVSVPAGEFESFPITYGSDTYWYSSEVGNLVKTLVTQDQKEYSFIMDLSLQSYIRNDQPIQITQEIDPSQAYIGQEITISGQALDETGNPLPQAQVTISIPRIGESWDTTTDPNGNYQVKIPAPSLNDDTFVEGELGSDGIVVTCTDGTVKGWQVRTLTIFDDLPPSPPSIQGITEGNIGESYDYTLLSSDPENDDIYYFVDWGDDSITDWDGPHDAGASISLSHTWDTQGTYLIRAKAKDELGAESQWATLSVTMPKQQIILQKSSWLNTKPLHYGRLL